MNIEPHSPTWLYIERWARDRIEAKRGLLENRNMPASDQDCERGNIECLRALLALADPEPYIEVSPRVSHSA